MSQNDFKRKAKFWKKSQKKKEKWILKKSNILKQKSDSEKKTNSKKIKIFWRIKVKFWEKIQIWDALWDMCFCKAARNRIVNILYSLQALVGHIKWSHGPDLAPGPWVWHPWLTASLKAPLQRTLMRIVSVISSHRQPESECALMFYSNIQLNTKNLAWKIGWQVDVLIYPKSLVSILT